VHDQPMESAIILAVPEAEDLVGALRLEGDVSAQNGVPAHVTLLYPFVDDPDDGVVEELRFFFERVDGFSLTFSSVGEFPEVVYLAPDEAEVVQSLIAALVRRWPAHQPYGGLLEVDEVIAHLTVVDTPDSALRERARAQVEPGLPITCATVEASLWINPGGGWEQTATFPLAEPG
jgi:2'-5' RNA ligase